MTTTAKRGGFLGFVLGNTALRKVIDADPKAKKALDDEIAALTKEKDSVPDPKPEEQIATDQGQQMADDLAEMKILLRSLLEKLDGASGGDPAATDEDPDKSGDKDPGQAGQDEEPEKKPVGDRAVADQRLVQDAALLAPALRARVGDSALVIKRTALRQACADKGVDRVVRAALGNATVDTASGSVLDAAFAVATEMVRARSNAATADALTKPAKDKATQGQAVTPADLNAMFADHRKSLGMGA